MKASVINEISHCAPTDSITLSFAIASKLQTRYQECERVVWLNKKPICNVSEIENFPTVNYEAENPFLRDKLIRRIFAGQSIYDSYYWSSTAN